MNQQLFSQPNQNILLSVTGLDHELRDHNSGVSFTIHVPEFVIYRGEFIALMGPTGAGKSTFLQILALLRQPTRVDSFTLAEFIASDDGAIEHDVCKHWKQNEQREIEMLRCKLLGYVPQHPQLLPALSVTENIEIPLWLNGSQCINGRIKELLGALSHPDPQGHLDLCQRAQHRPHQISGGQAQRVCVARAAAHNPTLLFADEPTSNLDPRTARRVIEFFDELRCKEETTIVMVTHDEELAHECADRVIRMGLLDENVGGIVEDEPVDGHVVPPVEEDRVAFKDASCLLPSTIFPLDKREIVS